ncbi:hypothetical protein AVEN_174419-1, partial [Araneus ventricosus]
MGFEESRYQINGQWLLLCRWNLDNLSRELRPIGPIGIPRTMWIGVSRRTMSRFLRKKFSAEKPVSDEESMTFLK